MNFLSTHLRRLGLGAGDAALVDLPASNGIGAETTDAPRGLAVRLRGLSKSYGDRRVLNAIDLDIEAGEFVAVVGRSGCGKSTLLRTLAGLEAPNDGAPGAPESIGFDGADVNIRLMFQDDRLLPWRRVIDNVALGLPPSARATAMSVLRDVGLESRAADWPAALSGGQKQRVALARALLHRPRLLLLDEPLGALDALTRLEMQGLIERIWQQAGFTAVLVTRDVAEAVALADRVLVIEEGTIALDLRIDLPRPRSPRNPAFGILESRILDSVLHPAEHGRNARKPALPSRQSRTAAPRRPA
ncbi:aliphatic sulfonate ABC transporter ATP-binding protein [Bordetella genomosp. 10]|uniref:Aliphatic sulfonate ABC transporter ATP-binding protein n=1 Tax=Bordetella genomosp. 10 TaxID=1416804 RepID=A0A261SB91_9BORD|nr:ATP-binding cassette domain-containing protein [Bordetella genomosp. 10]OZI34664.1 aliphatic sulfonate ABC transporter ATP-binding protein [Bordetella genomosp. 10]